MTYGTLKDALVVVAQHRGVALTDGPALLALSVELFTNLARWEQEVVARIALSFDKGWVNVPSATAA